MSKNLTSILVGITGLLMFYIWVLSFNLILFKITGLESLMPSPISRWLITGSIPLFFSFSIYLFNKENYLRNSLLWKGIYFAFISWLIILTILQLLNIKITQVTNTTIGYAIMFIFILVKFNFMKKR